MGRRERAEWLMWGTRDVATSLDVLNRLDDGESDLPRCLREPMRARLIGTAALPDVRHARAPLCRRGHGVCPPRLPLLV